MTDTRFFKPAALTLAMVLLAPALALDPPHNETNNITCLDCHAAHGSEMIPRDKAQEALCKSCHNPTGQAAALSDVGLHYVDGGHAIVDCGTCHDVHNPDVTADPHPDGQTALNLNLIRGNPTKYVASALDPAIFQQRPEHFAFRESNPPWNGICQTCHSQTSHHTNNETADHHHQIEAPCTRCHPHSEGFAPSGGCLECHTFWQESRRPIVGADGDFSRASHHVTGDVQDSDCVLCHSMRAHGQGAVLLKDPDLGSERIYTFSWDDPAGVEDFCLNCHDEDGARIGAGIRPLSGGQKTPNIKDGPAGVWMDSAHRQIGYAANSNTPLTCLGDGYLNGCHGNAHGSNLRNLLQPFDGHPGENNIGEEEGFCFRCHKAGGVINEAISNGYFNGAYANYSDNLETALDLHTTHPVNDAQPGHVFDIGDGPQELECTSCHGVHGATGKHWEGIGNFTSVNLFPEGELWGDDPDEKIGFYDPNHAYQAPSMGAPGNDLSGHALPIDAHGNSLLTDTVLPDYNTFCLACHENPINELIPIRWSIKKHGSASAEPLGPAGMPTGMPVAGPYVSETRGEYFLDCLDCHEPHGSENYRLLRRSVNGETVEGLITGSSGGEWHALCDRCHVSDPENRHHNDHVIVEQLGLHGFYCFVCHLSEEPDAFVTNCVTSGCHGHNDRL